MFSLVKNFFILIAFSFISSCHEKDYDIIAEAKNFIMKDRNTENSEKSKKLELSEGNKENAKIKETQETNNNKEEEKKSVGTKKNVIENKKLKDNKTTSRVLEDLKNQKEKEKNIENQENRKKTVRENYKYIDKIKVGVMLPLSGEHQEIGNLILNAIEMAVFQTEENKLEFYIKDTEGKSDKAKKVFAELIKEEVTIVIGPLFSK